MRRRTLLLLSACALLGCSHAAAEPGSPATDASTPPGPGLVSDAGGSVDAQAPACVTNPTTYLEIINACTDAQAVDKQVDLSPMNLADGGLQPLP